MNFIKILFYAITVALFVVSIVFYKISKFSIEDIANFLNKRATYGKIDWLTTDFIASSQGRFKFAAILIFALALALVIKRKKVSDFVVKNLQLIKNDFKPRHELFLFKNKLEPVLLLFAVILSLYYKIQLLSRALMGDEAFTILHYSKKSLPIIFANYNFPNNHIFHSLLSHFTGIIFGPSVWAYRLPALFFGVLLVPMTYYFVRKYAGFALALLAAVLVAIHPDITFYSTQARGYTMLAYFIMMSMFSITHYFESKNKASLMCFILYNVLAFWTIPVWAYAFAFFVFIWFLEFKFKDFKKTIYIFSSIIIGVIIVYLPVLLAMGPNALFANEYVISESISYLQSIQKNFLGFKNFIISSGTLVGISSAVILGLLLSFIRHQVTRKILVSIIFAIISLAVLKRVEIPTRVVFIFLPLILSLSVIGFTGFFTKLAYPAAVFIIWSNITPLQFIKDNIQSDFYNDVPKIADYFKSELKPNDRIFVYNPYVELFEYYFVERQMSLETLIRPLENAQRVLFVREVMIDPLRDKAVQLFMNDKMSASYSFDLTKPPIYKSNVVGVYEINLKAGASR